MPELPEVETVRQGLEPHLLGRQITAVSVLHPRPVRAHVLGPRDFETTLVGRTFASPRRRGKYLWLPFTDQDALLVHLGMSGQFRVNRPDDPQVANTRVLISLDDGAQLRFVDQRMFGGLSLSPGGATLPGEITHIALDPFDPDFDVVAVARRLRAKRSTLKRSLLDQTLISGIGNIYADETLWRVKLHGDREPGRLTGSRAQQVILTAAQVMREALAQGGTSFDSLYVNVNGSSGYFSRELAVYGREGLPCLRCGTPIHRDPFMNRSSFRCPRCQRKPASNS